MKQFEYKNYYVDLRGLKCLSMVGKDIFTFDELGKEGWQLVATRSNSYSSHYPHIGVWMREIGEVVSSKDTGLVFDPDIRIEPDDDIPYVHPGTW